MNQKIKFGVIGLGHIGVRHAQCILDHPKAELSAVCDVVSNNQWSSNNKSSFY